MKLGRTLTLLWLASLALFAAAGYLASSTPEFFTGAGGWVLRFFLGYCGIIVVAQVLAAMEAIRRLGDAGKGGEPLSWRLLLR